YDVFDCRLALALDDFAKVLSRHDIDEVRMFSAWRPDRGARADHAPETRHPGGLAMDAARFGKRLAPGETERRWLDVEKDFHGAIGAPVCGAGAAPPSPATPEARELRSIACEAVDLHLFTVVLTPNYNRAHRNHLHLEVTPGVSWSLVR
ncbi:MAG TPA: extensin family protein, partial [Minicystis sp.]|nr:extensin family protein [Minicystis sp.]